MALADERLDLGSATLAEHGGRLGIRDMGLLGWPWPAGEAGSLRQASVFDSLTPSASCATSSLLHDGNKRVAFVATACSSLSTTLRCE
jgi:hypothetical protein